MRTVITVIASLLAILAWQSISAGLFSAHAQTKIQRHCVWTYINDIGQPNIGEDGRVDFSKGSNWKRVSDEGWELKGVNRDNYIFERCE